MSFNRKYCFFLNTKKNLKKKIVYFLHISTVKKDIEKNFIMYKKSIWTPGHYDTWHKYSTLGFIAQILINPQKTFFDHCNADNTSFTMATIRFL